MLASPVQIHIIAETKISIIHTRQYGLCLYKAEFAHYKKGCLKQSGSHIKYYYQTETILPLLYSNSSFLFAQEYTNH